MIGLLGLLVLVGIALAISTDRRAIAWKTVGAGFALQFAIALVALKTPLGSALFSILNDAAVLYMRTTSSGATTSLPSTGLRIRPPTYPSRDTKRVSADPNRRNTVLPTPP